MYNVIVNKTTHTNANSGKDDIMSVIRLRLLAGAINPNKPKKHYPSFMEQCADYHKQVVKERETKEKEERKAEERRWKKVNAIMKEQKKEAQRIEKEEEKQRKAEEKYYRDHQARVVRKLDEKMTLCLVSGVFTSKGLEIKSYVSFGNRDGDIFTIRAKIKSRSTLENVLEKEPENEEKEIVFEYMDNIYTLTDEEIDILCDYEDDYEK